MNETPEKMEQEKKRRSYKRWYRFYFIPFWPIARLLYLITVKGRENIPDGPAVICAPHTSLLDPLLISFAMGRKHYVVHMAKAELLRSKLAAFFMGKAGSIFIRRGESDIEAFKQCIRVLKDGEKLMIFPEGTRIKGEKMGEFKPGAVRIAQKLQAPIVPVYLSRRKKLFRRTYVVFGQPYLAERSRGADPETLSQDLKERIAALEPR